MSLASKQRPHVVIVGGGFGGLAAARALRKADAEVTVVDRVNHHLFQPLLYQIACGGLFSGECAPPIRSLLKRSRNATVLMDEVTDVDIANRQVVLDVGGPLPYDHLIFAVGAETSYFGHDELAEHSFGLKTLEDTHRLREQIFSSYEYAERATDADERDAWMTFAVVGSGATGVEVAGALKLLSRDMEHEFSNIDPHDANVVLIDAGDRAVPAFSESLSAKVGKYLDGMGVVTHHHARATAVDAEGVTVQAGDETKQIAAKTVVWAAGVQAASLAAKLAAATGAETDRAGEIMVNPNMTVPGHPEISVIGDVAHVEGVPGLATAAIQQGRHVAKAIAKGTEPGPFKYFDKGALAVVGQGEAVCEVRGRKLSGRIAFFMYLFVHLWYLGNGSLGRYSVLVQWISARFGRLQARVVVRELTPP